MAAAGAMKHKEAGCRLFRDNHVMMVRLCPSSATNYCLVHGVVKPSFKTTGNYSTVVSLDKVSGEVMGAHL